MVSLVPLLLRLYFRAPDKVVAGVANSRSVTTLDLVGSPFPVASSSDRCTTVLDGSYSRSLRAGYVGWNSAVSCRV